MEIPRPYHLARQLFLTYTIVCSSSPVSRSKYLRDYRHNSLFTILHQNLTCDNTKSIQNLILVLGILSRGSLQGSLTPSFDYSGNFGCVICVLTPHNWPHNVHLWKHTLAVGPVQIGCDLYCAHVAGSPRWTSHHVTWYDNPVPMVWSWLILWCDWVIWARHAVGGIRQI
jgi:hypothetical protein